MGVILQTPSILPITPFDPSSEHNIEFVYQDVQAVKNRAVITDNETGEIVYEATQSTMRLYHTLPSRVLTASKKYLIQIQVFDENGNSSNLSEPVLFLCLTTPSFNFDNLTSGSVYKQPNITLELTYNQLEGEQLKNYRIIQYNASKVEISSSDTIYGSENLSYTFYGLENNTTYYFRAIGETQNGIPLDTGHVEINVQLIKIPVDAVVQLENDYCNGVVRLLFNIRDIHYTLTNDDYTFNDGMVTLNNTALIYEDGFSATDDFSLSCQINKVKIGTFLEMENGLVQLAVVKICDSYYCELSVRDSDFRQYEKLKDATLLSDGQLLTSNNEYITAIVRRRNGYYGLEII